MPPGRNSQTEPASIVAARAAADNRISPAIPFSSAKKLAEREHKTSNPGRGPTPDFGPTEKQSVTESAAPARYRQIAWGSNQGEDPMLAAGHRPPRPLRGEEFMLIAP